MKNDMKATLDRELQSVHVSNRLRSRILAEAAANREPAHYKRSYTSMLAMAAAIVIMIVGIFAFYRRGTNTPDPVLSQGTQTNVWTTAGDNLYHAQKHCGDTLCTDVTSLAEAKASGRTACPKCIRSSESAATPEETTWQTVEINPDATAAPLNEANYAQDETVQQYAEVTAEPTESSYNEVSDEAEATEMPLDIAAASDISSNENSFEAEATETPLDIAAASDISINEPSAEATETPLGIAAASDVPISEAIDTDASSNIVWTTSDDMYYHAAEECNGITMNWSLDESTCVELGKEPCPICFPQEIVYYTESGEYFHNAADCYGIQDVFASSRSEAVAIGKIPCPICFQSELVYLADGDRYYHFDPFCEGETHNTEISETEAIEKNLLPCPICGANTASAD